MRGVLGGLVGAAVAFVIAAAVYLQVNPILEAASGPVRELQGCRGTSFRHRRWDPLAAQPPGVARRQAGGRCTLRARRGAGQRPLPGHRHRLRRFRGLVISRSRPRHVGTGRPAPGDLDRPAGRFRSVGRRTGVVGRPPRHRGRDRHHGIHVLLLPFGWFLYVWSVPMLLRLGQLLGAHQRELQTHPELRRGPKVPPSTAASCRPSPRLWPLTGRDTSEVLTSSNDMPRRVTT